MGNIIMIGCLFVVSCITTHFYEGSGMRVPLLYASCWIEIICFVILMNTMLWLSLFTHSKKVVASILVFFHKFCIPPVSALVLSSFIGFLPQFKDLHIRLMASPNWLLVQLVRDVALPSPQGSLWNTFWLNLSAGEVVIRNTDSLR